jgi:hypothetical protein
MTANLAAQFEGSAWLEDGTRCNLERLGYEL